MIYIESLLLGISLAAIPGPIFFEVIRRTMTNGFWPGIGIACGDFMAFLLIMILTFFGVYEFFLFKPIMSAFFLIGGIILIWIGILSLKLKREDVCAGLKIDEKSEKAEKNSENSVYAGFAMSITNPMTILGSISMNVYLSQYLSKIVIFINILLLAIGGILFFSGLASIVHITRRIIKVRYIILFSKIFGIIIIGYGIDLWYQFYKLLK